MVHPPEPTGQELASCFRETGRQAPFEEIVRRYAGLVFNTCLRVTHNKHDAEDATQAVFLALAVELKRNKEIRTLAPWLQQVAKRMSLDMRRSRRRRLRREQVSAPPECLGDGRDSCQTDLEDLKPVISEELSKLPSKYRMPLILHYFGGMSHTELARELNCKPATLAVRLHRGRQMLGEGLKGRGVVLGSAFPLLIAETIKGLVASGFIHSILKAGAMVAAGRDLKYGPASPDAIRLARGIGRAIAMSKVKVAVAVALLVSTCMTAGAESVNAPIVQELTHAAWELPQSLPTTLTNPLGNLIRGLFGSGVGPVQARSDDPAPPANPLISSPEAPVLAKANPDVTPVPWEPPPNFAPTPVASLWSAPPAIGPSDHVDGHVIALSAPSPSHAVAAENPPITPTFRYELPSNASSEVRADPASSVASLFHVPTPSLIPAPSDVATGAATIPPAPAEPPLAVSGPPTVLAMGGSGIPVALNSVSGFGAYADAITLIRGPGGGSFDFVSYGPGTDSVTPDILITPEPASLGATVMAGFFLLRRSRRRKNVKAG